MTNKELRRRMNTVLDIVKFRKNKNAISCFDDDCKEIKERVIVSKKIRRRGDGSMQTIESETGNIVISCEVHNWQELFSVSQLDNMPMPERTTTVNENTPLVSNPESNVIER